MAINRPKECANACCGAMCSAAEYSFYKGVFNRNPVKCPNYEYRPFLKKITVLNGMTNGDVIKAMFPNSQLHKESDYIYLTIQNGVYLEDRDSNWWNAPYKREVEYDS